MGVHSNGKRACLLGENGDFAIGFWFGSPRLEAAVCSLVVDGSGLLEKTVERTFTTSLYLPICRTDQGQASRSRVSVKLFWKPLSSRRS